MFRTFLRPSTCNQPGYLKFNYRRCVTLLPHFRKLLHSHISTNSPGPIHSRLNPLSKPYYCYSSSIIYNMSEINNLLSKNTNFLIAVRASVTELLFLTITHQHFFPWGLLHRGGGDIGELHLMINLLLLHY
jgi:hypothetical protein